MVFTSQTGIWANTSQSFSESIPFISSGRYVYDTLDFLTTPFLYNKQKSDALSLKFTRSEEEGGLFAAGRISIVSFPIYWAVNLLTENTTSRNIEPMTQEAAAGPAVSITKKADYRFILGSHWKALGMAAYAVISDDMSELFTPGGAGAGDSIDVSFNANPETVDSFYQPRGNRYGIELGQSSLPIPLAWTIHLEYRETGGITFNKSGPEDEPISKNRYGAPGTIFDDGLIPQFESTIGLLSGRNGNNRKEARSNFLLWYTLIQEKLNAGISYSLTIPFGSGKNSDLGFKDEAGRGMIFTLDGFEASDTTPRATKLSGHDISVSIFADIDFYFGKAQSAEVTPIDLKSSIFRITPVLTYRNLRDNLFYNEGHNFNGTYEYIAFEVNFKTQIVLNEKGNMFLYLGWLPKVIFIRTYSTTTKTEYRARSETNSSLEINQVQKLNSPKAEYSDFTIGFSYLLFDRLKLNTSVSATDLGDKLDLTRLDLGIDYYF